MVACDQHQKGFGFVDFILIESDGLIEAIRSGRLETGFLDLLDGVSLGFAQTFAARVATFERIVGEIFDVRPPRVAIEV
ncbi:MAG TPA: hypothetical protein VNO32_52570 [Candidatus Acidoferrum sp.]|nr:hypothetical protein [Candidatus Acidoferrum sp.]